MKVLLTLAVLLLTGHCQALESKDLYDVVAQGSVTLPRGDEKSIAVNLQAPIHFFTEKYDTIYVSFPIMQPSFHMPPKCCARLHKRKRGIFRQTKGGAIASYHSFLFAASVRHLLKIFFIMAQDTFHPHQR